MRKLNNFAELADFRKKCADELNSQGKKILICGRLNVRLRDIPWDKNLTNQT